MTQQSITTPGSRQIALELTCALICSGQLRCEAETISETVEKVISAFNEILTATTESLVKSQQSRGG